MNKLFTIILIFILSVSVANAEEYKELPYYLMDVSVSIQGPESMGSGVIISPKYILTAGHGIESQYVKVIFYDKREVRGKVICVDEYEDLALVLLPRGDYVKEYARLLNREVVLGENVWHVGAYLGFYTHSLSKGIISGLDRDGLHQTNCTSFYGSSGGGIFTDDGECAGIVLKGRDETITLFKSSLDIIKWLNQ